MSLAEHIVAKTREKRKGRSRARGPDALLVSKAADLLDLITDPDAAAAVAQLRRALKATKRVYLSKEKGWRVEADHQIRNNAAIAILDRKFGKPIERQITASGTFEELSTLLARIPASPMAMKKLGHLVPKELMPPEKP